MIIIIYFLFFKFVQNQNDYSPSKIYRNYSLIKKIKKRIIQKKKTRKIRKGIPISSADHKYVTTVGHKMAMNRSMGNRNMEKKERKKIS